MTLDNKLTKETYDEVVALTQKLDELKERFVERVKEIFEYAVSSEYTTHGDAHITKVKFKLDGVDIEYEGGCACGGYETRYTNFPSQWMYHDNWKKLCDEIKEQEEKDAKKRENGKRKKKEEEAEKEKRDLYEKLKEKYEPSSPAPTE